MRERLEMILFGVTVLSICWSSSASLLDYGLSSEDVKEYIVDSITNCVLRNDIVLLQRRENEPLRESDKLMPGALGVVLGLQTCRLAEMLKGSRPRGGNGLLYLYRTRRLSNELPSLYTTMGGDCRKFYVNEGRVVPVCGKDLWRYSPPYDPVQFEDIHEYFELRFLSPVKELKRERINSRYYRMEVDKSLWDYMSISPDVLASKLGVSEAFSECVYQIEEGVVFQVDYPETEVNKGKPSITNLRHEELLRKRRANNNSIMHLSPDEASEIVYLAYLADKRYTAADYDAACKRCPKLLKHVKAFKTEIGKRLKSAMEAGGMLPKK